MAAPSYIEDEEDLDFEDPYKLVYVSDDDEGKVSAPPEPPPKRSKLNSEEKITIDNEEDFLPNVEPKSLYFISYKPTSKSTTPTYVPSPEIKKYMTEHRVVNPTEWGIIKREDLPTIKKVTPEVVTDPRYKAYFDGNTEMLKRIYKDVYPDENNPFRRIIQWGTNSATTRTRFGVYDVTKVTENLRKLEKLSEEETDENKKNELITELVMLKDLAHIYNRYIKLGMGYDINSSTTYYGDANIADGFYKGHLDDENLSRLYPSMKYQNIGKILTKILESDFNKRYLETGITNVRCKFLTHTISDCLPKFSWIDKDDSEEILLIQFGGNCLQQLFYISGLQTEINKVATDIDKYEVYKKYINSSKLGHDLTLLVLHNTSSHLVKYLTIDTSDVIRTKWQIELIINGFSLQTAFVRIGEILEANKEELYEVGFKRLFNEFKQGYELYAKIFEMVEGINFVQYIKSRPKSKIKYFIDLFFKKHNTPIQACKLPKNEKVPIITPVNVHYFTKKYKDIVGIDPLKIRTGYDEHFNAISLKQRQHPWVDYGSCTVYAIWNIFWFEQNVTKRLLKLYDLYLTTLNPDKRLVKSNLPPTIPLNSISSFWGVIVKLVNDYVTSRRKEEFMIPDWVDKEFNKFYRGGKKISKRLR